MSDVDFSQATFDEVDFQGSRFKRVKFPTHQTVLVIPSYPEVTRRVLANLPADDPHARTLSLILGRMGSNLGVPDSVSILVFEDLGSWGDAEFATYVFDAFLDADRDHRFGVRVLLAGAEKLI
jgi:hypothetical protein